MWTHRVAGMAFNFSATDVPKPERPQKGRPERSDGGILLGVFGTAPSF